MYGIFLTNEFLKRLNKIDSRIRKGLEKKIEEYYLTPIEAGAALRKKY